MHSCAWITLVCKCGEYSGADTHAKHYRKCPMCGRKDPLTVVESKLGGQNYTTRKLPFFNRKPQQTIVLPEYVRKAMGVR